VSATVSADGIRPEIAYTTTVRHGHGRLSDAGRLTTFARTSLTGHIRTFALKPTLATTGVEVEQPLAGVANAEPAFPMQT